MVNFCLQSLQPCTGKAASTDSGPSHKCRGSWTATWVVQRWRLSTNAMQAAPGQGGSFHQVRLWLGTIYLLSPFPFLSPFLSPFLLSTFLLFFLLKDFQKAHPLSPSLRCSRSVRRWRENLHRRIAQAKSKCVAKQRGVVPPWSLLHHVTYTRNLHM